MILHDPISIREPTSEKYADHFCNDPSILKNTTHIDFNDKNFTKARRIQVSELPQSDSHSTANLYVDKFINETSLVRNYQDNDFNNHLLYNIKSITLYKRAEKR